MQQLDALARDAVALAGGGAYLHACRQAPQLWHRFAR